MGQGAVVKVRGGRLVGRFREGPELSSSVSFLFVNWLFKAIVCWEYLKVVPRVSLFVTAILGFDAWNLFN